MKASRFVLLVQLTAISCVGVFDASSALAQVACPTGGAATAATDTACGQNAVAGVTPPSPTNGGNSAFGAGSAASGNGATALGVNSTASSNDTVAIGNSSQSLGPGAIAIGVSSQAAAVDTIAAGVRAIASGAGASAFGVDSQATTVDSTAIGVRSHATASGSSAFGKDAQASGNNSVALGANSTDGGAANVVSVGAAGAERRIVNVDEGTVSATSTDAINGSQLFATNTAVTTNTNAITTLNSTVSNHTVQLGDLDARVTTNTNNIGQLDNRVTALENQVFGNDQQIEKAFEGTAIALSMSGGALPYDKNYAVSVNWGTFEGTNAFSGKALARISESFLVHGAVGFGLSESTVGAAAGVTYAW